MLRKFSRKRLLLVLLAAVAVVLLGMPQWSSPRSWKRNIQQNVAAADRIVIDPTRPGAEQLATISVDGRAAVDELLGLIEFEPALLHRHCMCLGEVAIRFCMGDQDLMVLTLHHGQSIRIHDENWRRNRNMQLTPASRKALADWLHAHGYTPPRTSRPVLD